MPAERRGAPRADEWEGTVDAAIARGASSVEDAGQAPAIDALDYRKTAITVGALFIIGDIAGVLSLS